jgi:hypothetical protein
MKQACDCYQLVGDLATLYVQVTAPNDAQPFRLHGSGHMVRRDGADSGFGVINPLGWSINHTQTKVAATAD